MRRSLLSAVRALGLTHGAVHGEFRLNAQGAWPMEIAPRPIGGLCARALRFLCQERARASGSRSCCCGMRWVCRGTMRCARGGVGGDDDSRAPRAASWRR